MSSSKRSNWSSEQRRNTKHLSRKRLLSRGCGYEPFNGDHIKFLWAAYKRGQFPQIQPDLTPEEFREVITDRIAEFIEAGGDWYVLTGKTRYGEIPVGVVSVKITAPTEIASQVEPHVVWFPEASGRNKLECAIRFILDLRKMGNVLIIAKEPDWRFLQRICNYGVLRPVGKLRGHYADGKDATLYQGVK